MSKLKQFAKEQPLTPAIFYILLSLRIKDRHGYDIMKYVEESSDKKIILGPGTLYGAIKRLLEEKMITEVVAKNGKDPRRKYYSLTTKGRNTLHGELERYAHALKIAKKFHIFDFRFSKNL